MKFNPDEYVTVAERVARFYELYPSGKILTAIVEHSFETGFVLMRAEVYRSPDDALPASTGHAYEVKGGGGPNATSHIENAETSAVGRALANLGFEVKRQPQQRRDAAPKAAAPKAEEETDEAHAALDNEIITLLKAVGKKDGDLTRYHNQKHGTRLGDWCDAPLAQKRAMVEFLRTKLPEAAGS